MSIEEMVDYCKPLFSDHKFIDMVSRFCQDAADKKGTPKRVEASGKDPQAGSLENSYTIYVSHESVAKLNEIINNLPLITKRHSNISTSIYLTINQDKRKKLELE